MSDNATRHRERAEFVWEDRISPTIKGRYTINRSRIIADIAEVGYLAEREAVAAVVAMLRAESGVAILDRLEQRAMLDAAAMIEQGRWRRYLPAGEEGGT